MTALHPGRLERDGDTATRSTPLHKIPGTTTGQTLLLVQVFIQEWQGSCGWWWFNTCNIAIK